MRRGSGGRQRRPISGSGTIARGEPTVEVLPDERAVGVRFAELVTAADPRTIAFSRPTPRAAFAEVDEGLRLRPGTDVFQVDERVAPDGSDDRNLTLLERGLSGCLRSADLHPMPVGAGSADDYADLLVERCGDPPAIDVVHLGLGPDGHTASLLPGDDVLDVTDRWVGMSGPAAGFHRMTLTLPTLDAARMVVFVICGEAKARAVAGVLSGDPDLPGARVGAGDVRFLLDRAAASGA